MSDQPFWRAARDRVAALKPRWDIPGGRCTQLWNVADEMIAMHEHSNRLYALLAQRYDALVAFREASEGLPLGTIPRALPDSPPPRTEP